MMEGGAFRNPYKLSLNCDSQCLLKTSVSALFTSTIVFELLLMHVHKGHLLAPLYLLELNCGSLTCLKGE